MALVSDRVQADGDPEHLVLQRLLRVRDALLDVPVRDRHLGDLLGRQEEHLQALQDAGLPVHRPRGFSAARLHRHVPGLLVLWLRCISY